MTPLPSVPPTVPVSAIVAAFDRLEATRKTLRELQACVPAPAEIIVRVDGNRQKLATEIKMGHPGVMVTVNADNSGPGGVRNALLQSARHQIVASFDDDSYPVDRDYFARLLQLAADHPEAGMFAAQIRERDSQEPWDSQRSPSWVADFVGCGCAYRKTCFAQLGGYVPLPVAYGMEEADLSLRLHATGGRVLYSPRLRVFHDTRLAHHQSVKVSAGNIANAALLPFLRYPFYLLPVGLVQFARKVIDTVCRRRGGGAVLGMRLVVPHLIRHRHWRKPVPGRRVLSFLSLRRRPCILHKDFQAAQSP